MMDGIRICVRGAIPAKNSTGTTARDTKAAADRLQRYSGWLPTRLYRSLYH
jgi:hypothetical protein